MTTHSNRLLVAWLLFGLLALQARAEEKKKRVELAFLPGDARVISHSSSASRDTALIAYQVLPRVAVTTGGEVGFFGFRFADTELRLGLFGMFELETLDPEPLNFLTAPAGPYLWRGLLGYSLAVAPHGLATRLLGKGGALEAALSFRHESEHYTGSEEWEEPPFYNVPHMGDLFLLDLALEKAIEKLAIELRAQNKFFLPTLSNAYSVGPGADLIFRIRALEWLHPFWSFFGECLFGKDGADRDGASIPNNFLVRSLLGLVVVGKQADLQVYLAGSVGHGKGLLALDKEIRFGWGMRVVLFKSEPRGS